ncbi:MAG: thioredoxin family protein [Candidatus Methanofastidiosia archaeon]
MVEEIKVFGPDPPCIKCKKTAEVAQMVAGALGINMKKHDIFSEEAEKYNILMTPAVVFKDEVIFMGQVPTFDKLKKIIEEKLSLIG